PLPCDDHGDGLPSRRLGEQSRGALSANYRARHATFDSSIVRPSRALLRAASRISMTIMLFASDDGSHSPATIFFSTSALRQEKGSSFGHSRLGSVWVLSFADSDTRVR